MWISQLPGSNWKVWCATSEHICALWSKVIWCFSPSPVSNKMSQKKCSHILFLWNVFLSYHGKLNGKPKFFLYTVDYWFHKTRDPGIMSILVSRLLFFFLIFSKIYEKSSSSVSQEDKVKIIMKLWLKQGFIKPYSSFQDIWI